MSHHQKKTPKRRARGKWMRKGYGNKTKNAPADYKQLAKVVRKRLAKEDAATSTPEPPQ